ncbi:unnamed protein product [Anisakis simplex]|uniref:ANF_receptor domain-containing protein n=1 Tax=Anisakis simplex TaxID=6269 RepID=A0A0M3J3J8_ANISI|nr:unnamed protein product [Anisakis simplex]
MTTEFLKAVKDVDMHTDDYVYLLPWLQTEKEDTLPWIGDDGQILQNIKELFANAIIVNVVYRKSSICIDNRFFFQIDVVSAFGNTLVTPFRERLEASGMTADDLDLSDLYGYIHLYDALKLYTMAVRRALNETGRLEIVTNGKYIFNEMRRMTFQGLVSAAGVSSGMVMMDDLAERAPFYAAFLVQTTRDQPTKLVEMEPVLLPKCDGYKTHSGCYNLVGNEKPSQINQIMSRFQSITNLVTGFWPSPDGRVPPDEPKCGYRNERCDYTPIIIAGSALVVCMAGILSAYLLYRYWYHRSQHISCRRPLIAGNR